MILFGAASFLIFLLSVQSSESLATYSIDLSSEFIKVAIVKPGVPMEIALDKDSQRKTPAVVFMRNDERLFGNAAMNMGIKYPENLYHSIPTLLGKDISHPIVKEFMKNFPYYTLFMDGNNQLVFQHDKNTVYSVEELLAMMLQHSKEIAESFAEMPMKSGVIVIPPYFNQEERLAVLRAADIAGITVLQLINGNAAVALNYGIFRRNIFNATVQYFMFYDVGSSASIVSIIGYQVTKTKELGMMVDNPQLSIVGVGYDRQLGASNFILRIQNHLADGFNKLKKTKTDVKTVPRSMAKLYKESVRVLKVLSANTEVYAQVENVLDDQDFKMRITRHELETMCSDLFEKFKEPLHKALESAQLPFPVLSDIILMGGGTRIPKFQDIVRSISDRQELGKSINTDEAAALGAVYQAAYLSPGFKVKQFAIKDANLVPIAVDFLRYKVVDSIEKPHLTSRIIFDTFNPYPQKKLLTFNKHTSNFDFNVTYGFPQTGKRNLFHIDVENLTDVYRGYMDESDVYITDFKGVKAHFAIDNSGLFSLNYVEALFERKFIKDKAESTLEKIGSTISNLFGTSSQSTSEAKLEAKPEEKPEAKPTENKDKDAKDNGTSMNATQINTTTTESKEKLESIHQNLKISSSWKGFPIPSDSTIEVSKKKIKDLKARDDEKASLEKAKNELESYIFNLRSIFDSEIYYQSSTESERISVLEAANEASNWYEEQDFDTPREEYSKKHNSLTRLMNDIEYRVKELKYRPEVIGKLNFVLNTSNLFYENLKNLTGDGVDKIFTKAEYDALGKLITDTTLWFENTNKTFAKLKSNENPSITIADFEPHIRALEREIGYLLNKISIWKAQPPPPPPTQDTEKESADNKTKSTDQTSSEKSDGGSSDFKSNESYTESDKSKSTTSSEGDSDKHVDL